MESKAQMRKNYLETESARNKYFAQQHETKNYYEEAIKELNPKLLGLMTEYEVVFGYLHTQNSTNLGGEHLTAYQVSMIALKLLEINRSNS